MYGGGLDLSDLDLVQPDGSRDLDSNIDESIGCHVGEFAGLNVFNQQEGFVYYWAADNPRGRLQARQRGGQFVDGQDPEFAAYKRLIDPHQTDLDSSNTGYPGVVLVRVPIEVERQRRDREQAMREATLRGGPAEARYIERGHMNAAEREAAQARGADSLRFRRADHFTRATAGSDESGPQLDAWSPDVGIVQR